MTPPTTDRLAAAIDALAAEGYDTQESGTGTIYIAGIAPDSARYGGSTEPGSEER